MGGHNLCFDLIAVVVCRRLVKIGSITKQSKVSMSYIWGSGEGGCRLELFWAKYGSSLSTN